METDRDLGIHHFKNPHICASEVPQAAHVWQDRWSAVEVAPNAMPWHQMRRIPKPGWEMLNKGRIYSDPPTTHENW